MPRVLSPRALDRLRALQSSNLPFRADIRGAASTVAGPKGQPADDGLIAENVPCRVGAADPADVTKFISGQQTTLDIVKLTFALGTVIKKGNKVTIKDDRRNYEVDIVGVKEHHANATAEIAYAQEL